MVIPPPPPDWVDAQNHRGLDMCSDFWLYLAFFWNGTGLAFRRVIQILYAGSWYIVTYIIYSAQL